MKDVYHISVKPGRRCTDLAQFIYFWLILWPFDVHQAPNFHLNT